MGKASSVGCAVAKLSGQAAVGLAGVGVVCWLVHSASQLRTAPQRRLGFTEMLAVLLGKARTRAITKYRPRRIILIRHGQSEGNVDKLVYGYKPDNQLVLTDLGHKQAHGAGERLRKLVGEGSMLFMVSPFQRARQTLADILVGGDWEPPGSEERVTAFASRFSSRSVKTRGSIAIRTDPRLREQEWGNLQDPEKMDEVQEKRRLVGRFYFRFPEGESGADVYDRLSGFWQSLYREMDNFSRPSYDNYVIVSHGLLMRLFLMRYFHWSVDYFNNVWNPRNCEMLVLERGDDGRFTLTTELRLGTGKTERVPATQTTTLEEVFEA